MRSNVHVLNSGGILSAADADATLEVAQHATDIAASVLELQPVDVVVCDFPGLAIPELAVGGYCPGPRTVIIAIEPQNPAFQDWQQQLASTVVHELHHAKRWQGPGYGATLLDSLVSEGSAVLFEEQQTGHVPIYAHIDHSLEDLWHAAEPHLGATDQHRRWFFGFGDQPRWAGYALGRELARRYCDARGITAVEVAMVPATDVVAAW